MGNRRHVALGTVSFTVCFAAWGLISAFAPRFRESFHLTPSQTALLVAVPVLLGSLARIPMGILTDRFGGRAVFSILMAAVAIPVWIAPRTAILFGPAGGRISAGTGGIFVRHRRGIRLALDAGREPGRRAGGLRTGKHRPIRGGISGTGTRCRKSECRRVSHGVAILLVVWAVAFAAGVALAMLPRQPPSAKGLGAMIEVLTREKLSWLLAASIF